METTEQSGPCSNNQSIDASSNAPAATKPATLEIKPILSKGVENAKKRLRAFSIQKKTPIAPIIVPKPSSTGHTTVLIGKLSGAKPSTPKVDDEQKKLPRPPKPGSNKRPLTDSYIDLQKKTLAEIEDMKRKMELVELGIPLGLICPTSTSEKAMPTKAMPPIKHFLGSRFRLYNWKNNKGNVKRNKKKTNPAKVDEIIKEAKKARDEGRKYKFDYQKLLPDYDNPFQRKKEEDKIKIVDFRDKDFDREKKRSDRYDNRRHSDYRREERDKYKYKDKEKGREKEKEDPKKDEKETNVNLNDYLVCDSWSLDNDEKASSPRVEDKTAKNIIKHQTDTKYAKAITEQVRDSVLKKQDKLKEFTRDSPIRPIKMEKLQPVIDSFKFEIDPNDDEILDMFDIESGKEKYARKTKDLSIYSPTDLKSEDYDQDISKDTTVDGNDDTFLESIINEIKQEDMSDDMSQDKGLVEYDSPIKEETHVQESDPRLSITPELDDKMKYQQSQRSDYSDGYRSSESGYKTSDTTESGYKSMDSFRLSIEKDLEESMEAKMSKSTVNSLETWSFVLKICQPILFRHDKNKCYRETRTEPKLWYTENPKLCNCVKDRGVVYEELNMCKMNLVDRVYGCDQIPDAPASKSRNWYPRPHLCLTETHTIPVSNEWEGDDISQTEVCTQDSDRRRSNTPLRSEEVLLDREYQRFMKAVWPEVETRNETPRSTTPVKEDVRKKKKDVEVEKEIEAKKKKEEGSSVKKMKQLSSEGWSQESDIEEEIEKSKKIKIDKEKLRKRKRSLSSLSSESEPDAKKRKKILKKKALKKTKSKSAKKRRIGKKILKKLKEKEKKKKKQSKIERIDESEDDDSDRKNVKKIKKKKLQKKKKNLKRKKKEESTSSSSSSSTESSTDESQKKAKKKAESKNKKEKKRKRKTSTSDSAQSEELFDVNILNNIKTERLTDDEKTKTLINFSPRRQQKPREIINVKELQNDFVGNNIHIKKEVTEEYPLSPKVPESEKNITEKEKDQIISNDDNENVPKITEVIDEEVKEQIETKESHVNETPSPVKIPETSPNSIPQNIPPVETVSNIEVIPTISPIPQRCQIKPVMDESNMSLCSSQESVCSVKTYEKDDSHLRPSSQNSNYSFNDVISASQSGLYTKQIESVVECEENHETYQQDNYEMYEHLAMAYQSDVASQQTSPPSVGGEQRIETVVRVRSRGEIKCDWRPGLAPPREHPPPDRPSRWGLKPGEVNIVLTGGSESAQIEVPTSQQQQQQIQQQATTPLPSPQPVYKIQSLANRTDTATGITNGYDEAYMDMYGASDRLQYGDCFSDAQQDAARLSTLDARIDHALKNTVLGEVAKEDSPPDPDKDAPEKGILIVSGEAGRGGKRVSFADGYKPGQDSDVEEPPVKKRRKVKRSGCAWPCPAAHPDHVPLWDALPPPPPPPGSPPPRTAPPPPLHLLRQHPTHPTLTLPPALRKLDPNVTLPLFIPSEPPPALIRFP